MRESTARILVARWLGTVGYAEALVLQESLVNARRRDEAPDTLLLLEHPPVITLGRSARPENVLVDDARREQLGIEMHECGRGGDVTYHGPGQLVGYPILALGGERRDAHAYLRDLEEALILTAGDYGVLARRSPGLTGVWAGGLKLAAIGVRIGAGWVTSHGFALNVSLDLSGFRTIVPCGIEGRGVTSLLELTGRSLPLREVAATAAGHLARVLGFTVSLSTSSDGLAIPVRNGLSS
jgi:lipoyl(octanoyl) transferase